MRTRLFSLLLGISILVPVLEARSPKRVADPAVVKQQLSVLEAGTCAEVRTSSDAKALRGRVAAISEDALAIQINRGNEISERSLPLSEITFVRKASCEPQPRFFARILSGLAAIGYLFVGP